VAICLTALIRCCRISLKCDIVTHTHTHTIKKIVKESFRQNRALLVKELHVVPGP
jgi:hypothetical protein